MGMRAYLDYYVLAVFVECEVCKCLLGKEKRLFVLMCEKWIKQEGMNDFVDS